VVILEIMTELSRVLQERRNK